MAALAPGPESAESHDIDWLLMSQGLDREQQSRVDVARGQLSSRLPARL